MPIKLNLLKFCFLCHGFWVLVDFFCFGVRDFGFWWKFWFWGQGFLVFGGNFDIGGRDFWFLAEILILEVGIFGVWLKF